mgnify:CR=1 FL=1
MVEFEKVLEEEKQKIEKLYTTFKSKGSVYKTKDGRTMIKNNEPAPLPIFNKRLREVESMKPPQETTEEME